MHIFNTFYVCRMKLGLSWPVGCLFQDRSFGALSAQPGLAGADFKLSVFLPWCDSPPAQGWLVYFLSMALMNVLQLSISVRFKIIL